MLFEGLVLLLSKDADVAALLGRRIYPVAGPADQAVYPYCCYRDISAGHEQTLDGVEMSHKTIQFDVFCQKYTDGKQVLQALRNVLTNFTGPLDDGTRILLSNRGNEQDNFDFDQRVYHSFVEFEFEYVEP